MSIGIFAIIFAGIFISYWRKMLLTHTIVMVNFIIFVFTIIIGYGMPEAATEVADDLIYRPAFLMQPARWPTMLSQMYLHADFFHILFNMVFLVLLGTAFEERIGSFKFGLVYFISGLGAVVVFTALNWMSMGGVVGASGAVFGVLGGFAALYPRQKVVMPIPLGIIWIIRPVPVYLAAVVFGSIETFYMVIARVDGIAHSAHLGGLIFGVAAAIIAKRYVHEVDLERKLNIIKLEGLAVTDSLKTIYQRIVDADEPDLKFAWIEHFLNKAECPQCGKALGFRGGNKVKCEDCQWKLD
jgi:membrane associated rhomboid family serine protease